MRHWLAAARTRTGKRARTPNTAPARTRVAGEAYGRGEDAAHQRVVEGLGRDRRRGPLGVNVNGFRRGFAPELDERVRLADEQRKVRRGERAWTGSA